MAETKPRFKFKPSRWEKEFSHPDWYLRLENEINDFLTNSGPEERARVYSAIEKALKEGRLPLANPPSYNWDEERQPIDTFVIHHTSQPGDITLPRLSAIGLIRIYVPRFLSPTGNPAVRGQAVESGHFLNGNQVFHTYHWLIRPDGTKERLLEDKYIGWHAGNWAVNCRSIGVALSGDFEKEIPPQVVIESMAQLIKDYSVVPENVLGHREVNPKTTCPGDPFLPTWKKKVLAQL